MVTDPPSRTDTIERTGGWSQGASAPVRIWRYRRSGASRLVTARSVACAAPAGWHRPRWPRTRSPRPGRWRQGRRRAGAAARADEAPPRAEGSMGIATHSPVPGALLKLWGYPAAQVAPSPRQRENGVQRTSRPAPQAARSLSAAPRGAAAPPPAERLPRTPPAPRRRARPRWHADEDRRATSRLHRVSDPPSTATGTTSAQRTPAGRRPAAEPTAEPRAPEDPHAALPTSRPAHHPHGHRRRPKASPQPASADARSRQREQRHHEARPRSDGGGARDARTRSRAPPRAPVHRSQRPSSDARDRGVDAARVDADPRRARPAARAPGHRSLQATRAQQRREEHAGHDRRRQPREATARR